MSRKTKSLNNFCVILVMSQPDYPIFSKRHQKAQRTRRGAYNFEKTKEYQLAEKWFEERRENKLTDRSEQITTNPEPVTKTEKRLPPGLEAFATKKKQEPCDLDIVIPSYDDFIYFDPTLVYTIKDFKEINLCDNLFKDQLPPLEIIDDALMIRDESLVTYTDNEIYNHIISSYILWLQLLGMTPQLESQVQ